MTGVGPGLPSFADEPKPDPVPTGVIAEHWGARMEYDPVRFWFSWGFTFGRSVAPLFLVTASNTGAGVHGAVRGLEPAQTEDLIRVLKLAHIVSVWMIHGQTPEYVVQFLETAVAEAEL